MKKIFIDTNVFIDLILIREDYRDAAKVFSYGRKDDFSLHASVLTMANIAYTLRKVIGRQMLYEELLKFARNVSVESLTTDNFQTALSLEAKDFEDALQYACAKSCNCDILVTRNKKDFRFEDIEVLTPSEFIDKY